MTYRYRISRCLAAATLLAPLPTAAPARPPVPISHPAPGHRLVFDPHKFMRVSELRPGMRGYALTVFKGTKIDRFGIEILGVVSKFNNGKDYILFRALDGPPVTRHLNIAHGMSGSPIYINGRLVGAISMGIPGTQFARDPIALATPIEDMFDAWSPDLPSRVSAAFASGAESAQSSPGAGSDSRWSSPGPTDRFAPIDLPLSVSGVDARGLERLGAALAPYHFSVTASGGPIENTNPLAKGGKLVPGAAVGVSLVQGDIDITATGTVTYRDGNRVLLFGHPLVDLGPIDAPMSTAYVVDIFPSYQDSIKLGSPIKTVGRIFQDRPFSVGGLVGSLPHLIPMRVSIDDQSIKRRKVYRAQLINHPLLTSQLVDFVANQAISQVHGQPGDSVATVAMDVDVEEIGHVRRTNTFFDASSISDTAVGDLDSLMRLLSSNPFYPLAVRSVAMNVTIQNRHNTAQVDHIFVRQSKFAPGDTVSVGVVLKPFKRDPIVRTIPIKIPASTPDGTLSLSVEGGGSDGGEVSLGGGLILMRSSDSASRAGNVAQLVRQFTQKARNNELVARLELPTTAITIEGEKLSSLPPTLSSVMRSNRSTGLRTERDEVKAVTPTAYIVSGSQSLSITVQRKPIAESSRPLPSGGSPPSPAPAGSDSSSSTDSPSDLSAVPDGDDAAVLPLGNSEELSAVMQPPSGSKKPAAGPAGAPGASKATGPDSNTAADGDQTGDKPAPAVPPRAVGRAASVWRQETMADFAAGTGQNVSVSNNDVDRSGDVRLSTPLNRVADTAETYCWSLAPDGKGHVFAGTGDRGIVYRINSDNGKAAVWFKTGELEVNALTQDGAGNLYAGTSPHGIVFKIGPDGHGRAWFTAGEKYVTALAYDETRHRLYVATGGGTGRIYAVPDTGGPAHLAWFTSPEAHILSLALGRDGTVYAGSSPDGVIYRITPEGAAHILYDATQPSISSLAVDSLGNVYAGTLPRGSLYKVTPDGRARLLLDRTTGAFYGLQADSSDNLYACSGNTVYRISPDGTTQSFVAATDVQFLSLAADPGDGQVYAGTSTIGSVYRIGNAGRNGLQGQYQSAVHDAGVSARWGTLSWSADTPPGTHITLQTRTGDVERPDSSWSAWSPIADNPGGQPVASPAGRYFQYQVSLTSDAGAAAQAVVPRLRSVTVYYLTRNQPPTVRIISPQAGDALSKTATLQWAGSDPDKDILTYDLSVSSDGGRIWTPIRKRASPAPPPVSPQKAAVLRASLDNQPQIPAEVRQKILALTQGSSPAASGSGPIKETSFSWDTTEVPDGTYRIQIIASDKTSNPQDALTAKAVSSSFLVANRPPTLVIGIPQVAADGTITLTGIARTPIASVRAVQGRADGGDAVAASPDDGLFDSTEEPFTLTLGPLPPGPHTVTVEALDRAGNLATSKVSVTIR